MKTEKQINRKFSRIKKERDLALKKRIDGELLPYQQDAYDRLVDNLTYFLNALNWVRK